MNTSEEHLRGHGTTAGDISDARGSSVQVKNMNCVSGCCPCDETFVTGNSSLKTSLRDVKQPEQHLRILLRIRHLCMFGAEKDSVVGNSLLSLAAWSLYRFGHFGMDIAIIVMIHQLDMSAY